MVSPARIGSSTLTARPAASSPRVERRAVSVETSARNSSSPTSTTEMHTPATDTEPPGSSRAHAFGACTHSVRPSAATTRPTSMMNPRYIPEPPSLQPC